MIARLSGTLVAKSLDAAIVEAAGVGYEVRLPLSAFPALPEVGERVVLHIHTRVRDEAIELYGFPTADEKAVFELLIGVSGVGPRLALALLSGLPAAELVGAIAAGQVERLRAVPGIGKKTAERLVVELRDKLQRLPDGLRRPAGGGAMPGAPAAPGPARGAADVEADLLSALVNLGYTRGAAERAIARVKRERPEAASLAELLRETLKVLSS
ncbi:MAG TPA: Holliday junction branch migration protein RuvA, partial [Thermodesulfobacteriota bacterium]|nr:Holliday junction branch migration protein RuvA [Thermodesulfobacteriota bacterium]